MPLPPQRQWQVSGVQRRSLLTVDTPPVGRGGGAGGGRSGAGRASGSDRGWNGGAGIVRRRSLSSVHGTNEGHVQRKYAMEFLRQPRAANTTALLCRWEGKGLRGLCRFTRGVLLSLLGQGGCLGRSDNTRQLCSWTRNCWLPHRYLAQDYAPSCLGEVYPVPPPCRSKDVDVVSGQGAAVDVDLLPLVAAEAGDLPLTPAAAVAHLFGRSRSAGSTSGVVSPDKGPLARRVEDDDGGGGGAGVGVAGGGGGSAAVAALVSVRGSAASSGALTWERAAALGHALHLAPPSLSSLAGARAESPSSDAPHVLALCFAVSSGGLLLLRLVRRCRAKRRRH